MVPSGIGKTSREILLHAAKVAIQFPGDPNEFDFLPVYENSGPAPCPDKFCQAVKSVNKGVHPGPYFLTWSGNNGNEQCSAIAFSSRTIPDSPATPDQYSGS